MRQECKVSLERLINSNFPWFFFCFERKRDENRYLSYSRKMSQAKNFERYQKFKAFIVIVSLTPYSIFPFTALFCPTIFAISPKGIREGLPSPSYPPILEAIPIHRQLYKFEFIFQLSPSYPLQRGWPKKFHMIQCMNEWIHPIGLLVNVFSKSVLHLKSTKIWWSKKFSISHLWRKCTNSILLAKGLRQREGDEEGKR